MIFPLVCAILQLLTCRLNIGSTVAGISKERVGRQARDSDTGITYSALQLSLF